MTPVPRPSILHSSTPGIHAVGLLVTCLVDVFRPSVGFAAVALLEEAGCVVSVPAQSCCGQPAFNSGDRATARALAQQVITAFTPYDYVVAPSGSCAGMMKTHYPELFADDPVWREKADTFCAKTFELISFLTDILQCDPVRAEFSGTATYHDACAGLRELGIKTQPRRLLSAVKGLTLAEMRDADVCCGFGGTFCVKYPDISTAIVAKKVDAIVASGADTVLAGDLGCLMNIAGRLQREGHRVNARHVAEVLAGMTDAPPIGEPASASHAAKQP